MVDLEEKSQKVSEEARESKLEPMPDLNVPQRSWQRVVC